MHFDDTKIGMMLIELESPVIFGSTSTLHEDIDGPGVIGEMQRMHISPQYSPNKRGGGASNGSRSDAPIHLA